VLCHADIHGGNVLIGENGQEFLLTAVEEDRSEMYEQFIAMFEPRDVVDIAFTASQNLTA
jgi:hypothetical protein